MKVLALVTDGSGGYGGIAQYNRDFVKALTSMDEIESVLVLPRAGDRADSVATNAKIRELSPVSGRVRYSLRAVVTASRYRPDVIFCGHLFMAPLAWVLAKILRRPWWLQIHGIEAWDRPGTSAVTAKDSFPTWFPIRAIAESADLVTAVSRHTRRRFLAWANIAPEKVRVLPNTYDMPAVNPQTKQQLKARYGLASHRVILTVSRLDRADLYKGHDKVLEVMPELLKSDPMLTYLVVGDGDNRSEMERTARERFPEGSVRFAGRVSGPELEDYYGLADAFVMPSAKEGFGIVFLEAALHNLPVVAGNADGSIDACADGAIGTCIDPESPAALLTAIRSALASPVQGAALVRERFGPAQYRLHLTSVLLPLLKVPAS